jgi:hypothetical protein
MRHAGEAGPNSPPVRSPHAFIPAERDEAIFEHEREGEHRRHRAYSPFVGSVTVLIAGFEQFRFCIHEREDGAYITDGPGCWKQTADAIADVIRFTREQNPPFPKRLDGTIYQNPMLGGGNDDSARWRETERNAPKG